MRRLSPSIIHHHPWYKAHLKAAHPCLSDSHAFCEAELRPGFGLSEMFTWPRGMNQECLAHHKSCVSLFHNERSQDATGCLAPSSSQPQLLVFYFSPGQNSQGAHHWSFAMLWLGTRGASHPGAPFTCLGSSGHRDPLSSVDEPCAETGGGPEARFGEVRLQQARHPFSPPDVAAMGLM